MARWARNGTDFPDELYPPNPGWLAGCLRWLDDHPGQRVPFGEFGDFTDVQRLGVEEARSWYAQPEPGETNEN
jgi:hypothetical protein